MGLCVREGIRITVLTTGDWGDECVCVRIIIEVVVYDHGVVGHGLGNEI